MLSNTIGNIISIWRNENRVSSDGEVTALEILDFFSEDMKGLYGRLVEVDGPPHGSVFTCEVMQPGREVTNNCFDKGQLYSSLNNVQTYLTGLGIDVAGIIASRANTTPYLVRAHANAVSDLNAWYSPQGRDLTFGTAGEMEKGQDTWHLASDSDVSIHEFGHFMLDHVNPALGNGWAGEGRAIHEGFADALASLYFDDPEMSEDFNVALGGQPDKKAGLRLVNNDLTLKDVSQEEHDRGQVYAGLFWSVKTALADPNGPFKLSDRQAADLVIRLMFNQAALFTTSTPAPRDFADVMLMAIDSLASKNALGVDPEAFKSAVMLESSRRGLLDYVEPDPLPPGEDWVYSMNDARRRFGPNVSFIPVSRSTFIGGGQEIYQQQVRTSKGFLVDVVGGKLFAKYDDQGRVAFISTRDVREVGTIDETITISPSTARANAAGDASNRLKQASLWINGLWLSKPKNFVPLLKQYQMDARVADTALTNLNRRYLKDPEMKLVLIPKSNELHYEIKVGLAIYYVNAKTGSVTMQKDVFAD